MSQKAVTERRRRADGERSRHAILDAAARLATVEGIEGLSIGRLAEATGMSKSGLYAHFGSKEELQLATVAFADAIFDEEVVTPAMSRGEGLARVEALCDRFLSHVERRVFPGGCFFSSLAAELDTRPGPVRDRIMAFHADWMERMASELRQAQRAGDIDRGVPIEQLMFELNAIIGHANSVFVLYGDHEVFELARRGIRERLARASGSAPRRKRGSR
jgi:AcrR family transcriptional regulator